jgi:hypothetical protein
MLRTAENINESGDPAVIAYTILKTTGVRPRATASAKRRTICMPCTVSIAFGPNPQSGAFNEDVYESALELLAKTSALKDVAWEQKINPPSRPKLMPGSQPDKTLEAATIRDELQAAS